MATILDYYRYARLAAASYVDLGPAELTQVNGATFAEAAAADDQRRLPLPLANYFFNPNFTAYGPPQTWTVNYYQPNDPVTGFAATLFQQGTEKVLALRGTEPDAQRGVDLFQADLAGIGLLGMAFTQAVSMVNLILRLAARENSQVFQLRIVTSLTSISANSVAAIGLPDSEGNPTTVYIDLQASQDGVGLGLISAAAGERVTVTGHSLGGHLAVLAARLFPTLINPDAFVFNSPGFDPTAANFIPVLPTLMRDRLVPAMGPEINNLNSSAHQLTDELVDLFRTALGQESLLSQAGSDFSGLNIFNLESEDVAPGNDISLISSVITGQQVLGQEIFVTTEPNSHVIEPFMDSLALHALLYSMNNSLTLSDTSKLIESASAQPRDSEEKLTESLFKVLLKGQTFSNGSGGLVDSLPISDAILPQENRGSVIAPLIGRGDIAARAAFHDAVLRIGQAVTSKPELQLFSLVSISALDLSNISQGSEALGYRYALRELNSFVILGDNSIYGPHNASGELNFYDPASRTGSLSVQWIADRAEFLTRENQYFVADGQTVLRDIRNENVVFENRTSRGVTDLSLTVVGNLAASGNSGAAANPVKVLFGNTTSDVLTGGILSDRLYGDAGTDWLDGKGGSDYLEGGSGLDLYNYSAFSGLLSGNDGADVIQDTDGKGMVRYVFRDGTFANPEGTVIVDASVRVSGLQWNSADGRFTYTRSQEDLVITVNTPAGGSLTLKNFKDGDFGIRLWEARPTVQTASTISGDLKPQDFDPATPGVQTQTDGLGNVIVTAEVEVDRDDFLFGSRPEVAVDVTVSGEKVEAGGGHDQIFSDRPRGEADNGLGDADWILAGAGQDVIETGAGNDLIEAGPDGVLDGQAGGDIADGGAGNDEIYAEAKIALAGALRAVDSATPSGLKGDLLSGAAGDDWIIGDRANDLLLGGNDQDLLVGGAGDDNIWGDANLIAYTRGWQVERTVTIEEARKVYTARVSGATVADGATGAPDVIYGGGGADWMFADTGDDFIDGGTGDDVAFGDAGSDILIGGAGTDVLVGDNPGVVAAAEEGGDYLDGGAGDDELFGNGGGDILIGGPGSDLLNGGPGRDIYVFNKGDGSDIVVDTLFGIDHPEAGILVLGEGFSKGDIKFRLGSLLVDLGPVDPSDPNSDRDQIRFEGFDQFDPLTTPVLGEIRFADGESMTYEDILAQGFDVDGTEEDDDDHDAEHPMLIGTAVTDRISGFGGNDILLAAAGDDILDGGAGEDHLQGGEGNDVLIGGEGVDVLQGEAGADTYLADFDDIINDDSGGDLINLDVASVQDVIVSRALVEGGAAVIISRAADADSTRATRGLTLLGDITTQNVRFDFSGEELSSEAFFNLAFTDPLQLLGTAGDDVLRGFGGADHLVGLEGSDQLFGGAGDDTLEGEVGDDRLDGGAGADRLVGGQGADVYLIGPGTGRDTVVDGGDSLSTDALDFSAGIAAEAVTFARLANGDLTVTVDEVDEITITGHYTNSANRIEEFRFADGRIVTAGELETLTVSPITGSAGDDELIGGPFDEVLMGLAGADTLDGKGGNDVLQGGDGEDIYVLDYGMGQDTAMDSGVNIIALRSELIAADLAANRRGPDLLVSIRGSEEGLTLADYFVTPQFWRCRDVAGVEVTIEDVIAATEARAQQGAAALRDDYIAGLNAQASRELVAQGFVAEGQGAFSRTLAVPFSADYIAGAQYRTIVFRSTTGEITSTRSETFPMDAWNYNASGSLVRSLAQIQNQMIFGDSALIFAPTATRFQTSSSDFDWVGLDWTVTSHGSVTHDFRTNIQPRFGPPFDPVTGDPTFLGTIETHDEFLFQHNFARGEIGPVPDGVPLGFPHFRQLFPRIAFASITEESITQIFYEVIGGAGDNTIIGGDIVQAEAGNDTVDSFGFIDGGPGNDTLLNGRLMFGGAGDDQLTGGFGANRFWLSTDGNGTDAIRDVDGMGVTDFAELYYRSIGVPEEVLSLIVDEEGGPSLDDIIEQFGLPDLPRPGDLAAIEPVFAANDFPVDVVEFGAGVGLADLSFAWNVERAALEISWAGGTAQIAFPVSNSQYGYGVERFSFADGTALSMNALLAFAPPKPVLPILGTADSDFIEGSRFADLVRGLDGDDSIHAGLGNDVLDGGAGFDFLDGDDGDDLLEGGADNDALGGGDGIDVLDGGTGNDDLAGGEGDDVYLLSPGAGNDLIFEFDLTPGNVDTVRFGAGIDPQTVTATYDGFDSFVLEYTGDGDTLFLGEAATNAAAVVERFEFADGTVWDWLTVERLAGFIVGTEAADVLAGGAGTDTIRGLGGDDEISAEGGDDRIFGGAGNDTYVFNLGDGVDTIIEADGFDTLSFGAGITSEMVTLGVGSLLIRVGENGDGIHIEGFDPGDALGSPVIELFQFADGLSITYGELLTRGFDIIGTENSDWLSGTNLEDRIDGLAGSDDLQGGRANDILKGGDGADTLLDGQENNLLDGGAGDDAIFAYGMPIFADGGNNFVIGGTGNDWIYSYATKNVIAFNTGDGQDTVYAVTALALSLGGGIAPSALSLSQDGADLVLAIGASDSIRLTRQFEANPQAWPAITLQLFGSVHLYDFNAVIADFQAAIATNPSLVNFPLDGVLQSHQTSVSETDAYGGALAYQYGTTGNVSVLSDAAISQFLADIGFGTATQSIAIPGIGNQAPVLSVLIVDQSAQEDEGFSFAIPAETFTDADAGDTLAYTAALLDGSPLPGWLSFDGATQSFSGTPVNADVGTISVKITATDDSDASVSDIFDLTVTNTNDVPVLANAIADQTATEDAAFSFTLPANTFADVDAGDTLVLAATQADGTALPSWVFFDTTTRTFSGTPLNGDVGTLSVKVTAMDVAGASAFDTFDMLAANTNDAPQLGNLLADQFGNQNALFRFAVLADTFTDVDAGDALSFSAVLADGSALPAWLAFDPLSRSFSGTPSEFDVGDVNVRVTATDNAGATAADTFTLSVSDASKVNETHVGTRRRDVIVTGIANDLIDAGRGDDIVHAGAGRDIVFGGRGEDLLHGEAGNDRLYGGKGEDQLYGGLGQDLLYGGRGGDTLEGGAGADLLSGGAGRDLLTGGAGENLLIGGAGRDTITGGPGAEVFLVNLDDGQDELHLTGAVLEGNHDVLSLGGGIGAVDISLKRDQGDLMVEARDADNYDDRARVILKDWYQDAGDHQTVATLQLFDGGTAVTHDFKELVARFDAATQGSSSTGRWNAAPTLAQVQLTLSGAPLGGAIAQEYAMSGAVLGDDPLADEDAEERAALPGGDWDPPLTLSTSEDPHRGSKHERDAGRDDRDYSKDKHESLADVLESYLAQKPQYEFEAFVRELERSDRRGEDLSEQDIAHRWQVVGRYGNGLSNENDDDAQRGAVYRFNEQGLLGSGALGGGFGYTGSTGMARGNASLRALQGLEEGFQRLRS